MKLTFLGGADEVGASCTLIEIADKIILVDAGIRISPKTSRGIQNDQLPDLYPISEVGGPDYILVTHAHTDHTGALPLILERYPNVPVLMTQPTMALVTVLQKDAQRIMKSRQEEEGELPLFDEISVQRLMDAIQLVQFDQPIRLGDGLQVTYRVAGHIAGAAMLVFESAEGTLVMSGDISQSDQRTVLSVQVPNIKADALVMESTYGGKLHANRIAEERRLITRLKEVTERGGRVLIPAFALGRSQEIIQIILAYRDQLDAPVYVDGMVRAVCDAYAVFSDLLPENTVKRAEDKHLFFREKISRVRSGIQRKEIARNTEPYIVVASSGMLTGGASVVYAKEFAKRAEDAILLTGYQDEESPGRQIQNTLRDAEQNKETTITLNGKKVPLRCELGTYSLSAHSDENELIAVAEAFDASEIMLVHGDPAARHSIATKLRQRGRTVITPKIGQTRQLAFAKRPWGIGAVKTGNKADDVNIAELWNALKDQAGSFFSGRELAQIWWGDGKRDSEMIAKLNTDDNYYFSPDWRNKKTFQVRTRSQVERREKCRAIMLQHPDIVGKLIVLRNVNGQVRLGMVKDAGIDSFDATVQSAKGTHHPADSLLWVIGEWQPDPEGGGLKGQLAEFLKVARSLKDTFLPFSARQAIVDKAQPVNPETLMPKELPEGVTREQALTAIVLGLASDGAMLEAGGLLPKRAKEHGPVEQNTARDIALTAFPPEARLRKVGIDVVRQRLLLDFDFPAYVEKNFQNEIENLMEQTNWDVHIKPSVNQQALGTAIREMLPEGASITKGPSFYMNEQQVIVDLRGITPKQEETLRQKYLELTGHRLISSSNSNNNDSGGATVTPQNTNQMEINAAYGYIRATIDDPKLHKVSLKQNEIILMFVSPQIGNRYQKEIAELAEKTGYPIGIHPHPNQQQILDTARTLIRNEGWLVRKGPGIHIDKGEVSVTLIEMPEDTSKIEALQTKMEQETGYTISITT